MIAGNSPSASRVAITSARAGRSVEARPAGTSPARLPAAAPVRHPVRLAAMRDVAQQFRVDAQLAPDGRRAAACPGLVVEQVEETLAHHDVLPQRHRPVLVDHHRRIAPHGLDPATELLGVADRRRQADHPHLVGQMQDHLLPHRTTHPVGEEMHLVHDHEGKSLQRRRIGVEHVAQHFGGHHHHGRVGVHRHVAGQQPDPVAAVARRQVGVLLVAQRFERRGVEAFAPGRQRQVHGEFADHRLAGSGRCADQHTVAVAPAPHRPAAESRRAQRAVPR